MIKAAGLLLVFAASALYGFLRAGELRAAQRELETLTDYFRQFELLLRTRRAPTYDIVSALAGQKSFAKVNFSVILQSGMQKGGSFAANLPAAVASCCAANRAAVGEILSAAAGVIGAAELEAQLSAIDLALLRLRQADTAAGELCRTRCPMYRRLGVLGGILIIVILA